ncbi:MAG: pyridoxamine kinase [Ruminococcus sp.]|nr:pyridoxamine kinase [Ruminococcus sp.]
MKRAVTIQDISCFGKCSLTVALPIISAMGIETAVIPTAVLSTHTGGFSGYTFRDLTGDIPQIASHWEKLGLGFDAVYTGYLGSPAQVQIVSDFIDTFGREDNFIVVDPVMGDAGKLYAGFTDELVSGMRKLCTKADYVIPNMTEAAFLLDIPYEESADEEHSRRLLRSLAELGCKRPVLTGVRRGDEHGAVAYDSESGRYHSAYCRHIDRRFHGTGDIFASVFTGAVTLGKDLGEALELAVRFTSDCITATLPHADEVWYGSCFELCLGNLIDYLRK